MAQKGLRMKKELELLAKDPPFGVNCWPDETHVDLLFAQIMGLTGTSYENGLFKLEVVIPERYPFEPPSVRFLTPIYHPNIDTGGRICLDILKMPPKGSWKPSLNVGTVLTSIQQLMAEPNPDDALMSDIASQFSFNRADFDATARLETRKHAMENQTSSDTSTPESSHSSFSEVPTHTPIRKREISEDDEPSLNQHFTPATIMPSEVLASVPSSSSSSSLSKSVKRRLL